MAKQELELSRENQSIQILSVQAKGSDRFRNIDRYILNGVEVTALTISLGALGYAAILQNYYALAVSAAFGIGGIVLSAVRHKRS